MLAIRGEVCYTCVIFVQNLFDFQVLLWEGDMGAILFIISNDDHVVMKFIIKMSTIFELFFVCK